MTDTGLSLREVVEQYAISRPALIRLLAARRLPAWKVKGSRVWEWRVPVTGLERAGYERRT